MYIYIYIHNAFDFRLVYWTRSTQVPMYIPMPPSVYEGNINTYIYIYIYEYIHTIY